MRLLPFVETNYRLRHHRVSSGASISIERFAKAIAELGARPQGARAHHHAVMEYPRHHRDLRPFHPEAELRQLRDDVFLILRKASEMRVRDSVPNMRVLKRHPEAAKRPWRIRRMLDAPEQRVIGPGEEIREHLEIIVARRPRERFRVG